MGVVTAKSITIAGKKHQKKAAFNIAVA